MYVIAIADCTKNKEVPFCCIYFQAVTNPRVLIKAMGTIPSKSGIAIKPLLEKAERCSNLEGGHEPTMR